MYQHVFVVVTAAVRALSHRDWHGERSMSTLGVSNRMRNIIELHQPKLLYM